MSHQLLRHPDENLPGLVLLGAGEVGPQLMRGNPVVARVRRGRSGMINGHRC